MHKIACHITLPSFVNSDSLASMCELPRSSLRRIVVQTYAPEKDDAHVRHNRAESSDPSKGESMKRLRVGIFAGMVLVAATVVSGANARVEQSIAQPLERYIVVAKHSAAAPAVKSAAQAAGGKVVATIPEANISIVVGSGPDFRQQLAANPNVQAIARDHVERLIQPGMQKEFYGQTGGFSGQTTGSKTKLNGPTAPFAFAPPSDPGSDNSVFPGLPWNLNRIGVPAAWNGTVGGGTGDVLVGVADTGLDYTHTDLGAKVANVVDFTNTEDPNICTQVGGFDDAFLAALFGAPSDNLDFNGHGSWIGGNIAGRLNGIGINGAAPGVSLVSLKISQWCGSAYDSTILQAFYYAASAGIDVVSISFGGYLDRTDPDQDLIYRQTAAAVDYATRRGTTIVAAAGNDHTRIGAGGKVISHGILDIPPGGTDYFGLWETPGGIPGVVDVSSTGNVVNAASTSPCPADAVAAGASTWCKSSSDAHQPFGVGRQNQLTYYSNYGPRIDVAGPGGARKFNIPSADGGGCEGWPICGTGSVLGGSSAADGYNAWEDFSITSNWAIEIPCIFFTSGTAFPLNECYSIIQGTSMATPHASATLALIATAFPQMRHNPALLVKRLKQTASRHNVLGNTTPPVSGTDTSNTDRTGLPCPGGYCHLGGTAISNAEAFGAGVVNADSAVRGGHGGH
jgi:hypothetical protein